MSVNRYAGPCVVCKGRVPARGGVLVPNGRRRGPAHLACADGTPRVVSFYSPTSGHSWTRNAAGTCEDAPCCGCCS